MSKKSLFICFSIFVSLVFSVCLWIKCGICEVSQSFPGNTKELVFGMSTVLTGPNSSLGKEFSFGVKALFERINREGGIRGKKLKLIVLDDGYNPKRTIKNMNELIKKYKVLGIIGNVGTPTGVVAMPIAIQNRVLFFAPFTGASALRPYPPNRYVFHYRASYYEEIKYLLDEIFTYTNIKPTEVAFFTQKDAYGDEIFRAGLSVLKEHGLQEEEEEEVIHVRYPRNTFYVKEAAARILRINPPPRVIVLGGTYSSCSRFIKILRKYGFRGIFVSVSFIGGEALASIAKKDPLAGEGVIISQVVPYFDKNLPLVRRYLKDLKMLEPEKKPTLVSLEGYIAASILVKALKKIKGDITRESIVDAFESLGRFDIGIGVPLSFSSEDHQASHYVWATVIKDGKVIPFDFREFSYEAGRQ